MTNLSPEFCFKIKAARQQAKLSQGEVSAEVGCKQSALSMFEQGRPTKLNEEVVIRLSKKFSIPLTTPEEEGGKKTSGTKSVEPQEPLVFPVRQVSSGFCPNPSCPSNHHYTVNQRELCLPDLKMADPVGGRFCAVCGELLERKCPNCGAPVHAGAICSHCGEPYVALVN